LKPGTVGGRGWKTFCAGSVLAVLETRDPTLSCIMRLLTDTPYGKGLVGKLENAMVKEFFVSRFDRWNARL